jgi:hypothetical protein
MIFYLNISTYGWMGLFIFHMFSSIIVYLCLYRKCLPLIPLIVNDTSGISKAQLMQIKFFKPFCGFMDFNVNIVDISMAKHTFAFFGYYNTNFQTMMKIYKFSRLSANGSSYTLGHDKIMLQRL